MAAHRYTLDSSTFTDWHEANLATKRAVQEFDMAQAAYLQALKAASDPVRDARGLGWGSQKKKSNL